MISKQFFIISNLHPQVLLSVPMSVSKYILTNKMKTSNRLSFIHDCTKLQNYQTVIYNAALNTKNRETVLLSLMDIVFVCASKCYSCWFAQEINPIFTWPRRSFFLRNISSCSRKNHHYIFIATLSEAEGLTRLRPRRASCQRELKMPSERCSAKNRSSHTSWCSQTNCANVTAVSYNHVTRYNNRTLEGFSYLALTSEFSMLII